MFVNAKKQTIKRITNWYNLINFKRRHNMVVVQNAVLRQSIPVLNEFVKQKLPIKTSYKILKLVKAANDRLETYEQTCKQLRENFLKKDDKGEYIPAQDEAGNVIPGHYELENPEQFRSEMTELDEMMVDIDATAISFEELGNDIMMEPARLNLISWVFAED